MKGAFEFGFIMLFSLPMIVFGIGFVEIMMNYNQARYLQNYTIMQIEHQNRLDDSVYALIEEGKRYCDQCDVRIININERYRVTVTFPIRLPIINYEAKGMTSTLTQIIKWEGTPSHFDSIHLEEGTWFLI